MMLEQSDGLKKHDSMAGDETTLKIITQAAPAPGTAPVAGGIPTAPGGGVAGAPRGPGAFGAFQEAFGDSLRDFSSNLTASITATLSGALVGRATGSFTAAGAVSTIVGQTVRTIQARSSREEEFGKLSPEEQLIRARETAEGRRLNPLERLLARGEVSAKPGIARQEAEAAGLVTEQTKAAGAAARILPVMGILLAGGLIATEAIRRVSAGLQTLEESLAPFSGEIAAARANVEIRAIEGRIRRAEEFGPALASLAETRGNFEESFEDFKTKILVTFIPLIEGILTGVTSILNLIPGFRPDPTEDDFVERIIFELISQNDRTIQETKRIMGRGQIPQ